ncbi:alpha/beta fold hydrolase [Microbacterium dextranolyticum]|uniref:Alpha/beta hydrolase n=1 Tax=Microbacterium dextranolyticum TaxID=36806 RepID=A0A9W6HLZ5_9MICO|nr:alpha/beta fold hydrolase [Microbacterium dextranolyticum]MBM7464176.1 pimeloyl-ACP methyl ester carboxylesterase [Microbacterium dextranolyticum]GLJ95171.1 alpha/beta hydrolase [Microbacterium dextranolyticum]
MSEQVLTVRRRAGANGPAFDLTFVRSGPRTATPVLVIPGGPGLASLVPYRGLRRWAAQGGLDLLMVEHRGVGRSRHDLAGRDLPLTAMRIDLVLDDLVAVLDHERVDRAFVVGSSYGSYLAAALAARRPDRVAGLLLDSALRSPADIEIERRALRGLFWDGGDRLSADIRTLARRGVDERTLLDVARAAYELGGRALVEPLVRRRAEGRSGLAWRVASAYATRDASIARIPGVYEFDLVGAIGFRELGYGAPADGGPLDPALTYAPLADRFPAFEGAPDDFSALPAFDGPLVALAGDRDLRTPPVIAERVVASSPGGVLVRLHNGHSALDTHPIALLNAVRRLVAGRHHRLPAEQDALDRLPLRGWSARLPAVLGALARIDGILPD